jgi:hypothetical protein
VSAAHAAPLRELERLREHREQRALRELELARDAERRAQQALAEREQAQRALEADIVATAQRPYADAGRIEVPMIEVQRSRQRVEWLAEQLIAATREVREAQAALLDKTGLRQAAVREHALAHAKHEAVHEQRVRGARALRAAGERLQLEEVQERGNAAPVRIA